MAKFLRNLLKDRFFYLFNITNIIFPLVSLFDSKMPLVNSYLDTRYVFLKYPIGKDGKQGHPSTFKWWCNLSCLLNVLSHNAAQKNQNKIL